MPLDGRADRSSADALLARLIKLTSRKEDFITECFAAVLQADRRAAAAYWRLLGAHLPANARTAPVSRIDTQCRMQNGAARCDLVLQAGAEKIAVEHKIQAPQGRDQLLRYLALPRSHVSRVALVAGDYQTVPKAVLSSSRYLRPRSGQDHFLWADFYSLLRRSEARGIEVAGATRGLFDRLGLQPAHPLIGELGTRDKARRQVLDGRLYAAWQPLLKSLRRRWGYADSSIRKDRRSEIWINAAPGDELLEVWLDPFSNPGSLRIRLKTDRRIKRDLILSRLEAKQTSIPFGRSLTWQANPPTPYRQRYPWALEARVPWKTLLARATRSTMPSVLKRHVLGLINVAEGTS